MAAFFVVLAVAAVALYTARARYPGPDSGEFWSDSNIINASRGFDEVGFTATWGLPRIQLAAPISDTKALYLSYPPGPYWMSYGAWRVGRALGVDPVLSARMFAQTCGLASAGLAFLVFARLARSRAIGALAGMFYVLCPAFLSYSAALHHMAYSPMLLFAAMRCWLAFEDGHGRGRWWWLAGTALLFGIDCWVNLEHMFFFALFAGARTAFHFRLPVVLGAALVGPIPIPMMALRVLHNAQVLGGWDAAMAKFTSTASRRSSGGRLGVDLGELALSWAARLDFPVDARAGINLVWNREYVFPAGNPWVLGMVGVVLVSVVLHRLARPRAPRELSLSLVDPGVAMMPLPAREGAPSGARLLFWTIPVPGSVGLGLVGGLLLLACGLTWFVVMTQHTQPHRFIVLLLMPGLSLLLGSMGWWVVDSARTPAGAVAGPLAWWIRARAWLVLAGLVSVFAWQVRRADVLNQLGELEPGARRMAVSRIESNANTRRLGHWLRDQGVTRVHMFDGANMMPWRAASIGVPFLYARKEMPGSLEATDAVYAEAWDPVEIAQCLDAIERWGLPDLVAPPEDRVLVFRGSRGAGPVDVPLNATLVAPEPTPGGSGGVVLRSMRWAPTALGDRIALSLWVEGDLASGHPDAALSRFTFTLRVRGVSGEAVHEVRSRLRWAPVRDERRALLFLVVPVEAFGSENVCEFSIWDRRERAGVAFHGVLPEPLRSRGDRLIRWPARGLWVKGG